MPVVDKDKNDQVTGVLGIVAIVGILLYIVLRVTRRKK